VTTQQAYLFVLAKDRRRNARSTQPARASPQWSTPEGSLPGVPTNALGGWTSQLPCHSPSMRGVALHVASLLVTGVSHCGLSHNGREAINGNKMIKVDSPRPDGYPTWPLRDRVLMLEPDLEGAIGRAGAAVRHQRWVTVRRCEFRRRACFPGCQAVANLWSCVVDVRHGIHGTEARS
jgi:hypothetical protein